MSRHNVPRPDSAAHKVMCRLVDLGGKATIRQLMPVLGAEFHSIVRFNNQVTDQMIRFSLATVVDDVFVATTKCKELVAEHESRFLPPVKKYVGKIAAPRVAGPVRPLNIAKLYPPTVVREGAFDHQKIPSMMGGKRILPGGEVVE